MKVTKTEWFWLIITVVLYVLYNIPGLPPLGDSRGMIIHALLTVLPLWIAGYVGMSRVYRLYRLREQPQKKEREE